MNPEMDKLNKVANRIEQHVTSAVERWQRLPDKILKFRSSENAWSTKEIIGHLIDSASNNHQRFVRLQLVQQLIFPDYGQDNIHWVRIQNYQDRPWEELLGLWHYFNIQLAHIIRAVDPACLTHFWEPDESIRVTLFDLMTDYLRHLETHLDQITDTIEAFKAP
jgi:DinB superfamily